VLYVVICRAQIGSTKPEEALLLIQEVESPSNAPGHLWSFVSSMWADARKDILCIFDARMARVSILRMTTLELLRTWGKKGRGPGEFADMLAFIGVRRDTVFVSQRLKTLRFLMDGTYIANDIRTLDRADFNLGRTSGVDMWGRVYYPGTGISSPFLVLRIGEKNHLSEGVVQKSDFGISPDLFTRNKMRVSFSVLENGSVILTLSGEPLVARYDPGGSRRWSVNLLEKIPYLKKSYEEVRAGKAAYATTTFWADEIYTILTFVNETGKIGETNIYFVFLDSETGKILKVAYAAQNVIREGTDKNKIYKHDLYNPFSICHSEGFLFTFSYNSAHLQKYKLTWHK
jgi:hypothetical protein